MSVTSASFLLAQIYERARIAGNQDTQTNMTSFNQEMTSEGNSSLVNSSTRFPLTGPASLQPQDKILLAAHGIIFLLALVGNGLVIATLAQNRRMRTVTNIFLLNLAVSDLLLAVVCMPFTVIPMVYKDFIFGPVMCWLIRYLQGMSVSASAFTLVAISLERFFAICDPLKSRKWQHQEHSYKVLAAIWLTAMIVNIPMAIFQKVTTYPIGVSVCVDEWPHSTPKLVYYILHLIIADLVVPLAIMSVAYGFIAKTLWNGFRVVSRTANSETAMLRTKRQLSLASEVSDVSDETDTTTLSSPPALLSPNGVLMSPTERNGDTHKFLFPHRYFRSVSRQETVVSLRSHSSQSNIRSKKRVVKMLFVIIIEFFVCWTPLYVISIWIVADKKSLLASLKEPMLTLSLLRLLAYISSCCNPITYCFMSKKFRSAFLTVFKCRKEPKPFRRRPTLQSTQVSYCDTPQNGKAKLQAPTLNGHNKPLLSVLQENSSEKEM